MPPHVDADSHHDDWHPAPRSRSLPYDHEPSPLFRDSESAKAPPRSPLDRRQSDPDFTASVREMVRKDDPAKHVAAPVVSVITAIIGPESAYVRSSTGGGSTPADKGSMAAAASTEATGVTAQQKQSPTSTKKPPSQSKGGKTEHKPLFLRASRYVSKKGWKVVKSLPNKVASTVGSVKVPGHHRNVV
eukprot:CAMPEP_0172548392 /NCGR_PEP_ID=MMETSP1067-20121228/17694_1 /TAXON_ID=265564 ORGANISM="Thalassiosira punctigera, Strain Tpunct2005C2" /NCGR_SAMPLE_ID=MMETSP1067 /ASSEMBLY_ACC=CAM_ASM_000444 /LENGTH=187 /DNA_ID=CAMNT_0013335599 /DNA_START=118 /DNA_END=681 /DNA_ORIENTATION=-